MRRYVVVSGLVLLLAGCGGGGGTTGGGGTAGGGATGSGQGAKTGRAAETGISTVTFTAKGGLNGKVSLSTNLKENPLDLVSVHKTGAKQFSLDLTDQSGPARQQFILDFTGYTGPGTYRISPARDGGSPDSEAVHFELVPPGAKSNNLWLIDKDAPGTCTVTVTSVTPVPDLKDKPPELGGRTLGFSEVQADFACPSVPVYQVSFAHDNTPALAVTGGHLDVVMVDGE